MSFKQIFIKNRAYLSYQNNSMAVKNESGTTLVSLDDIDILIIENQQTTITSSLLSHLVKANIAVVFVDERYIPSAICTGLYKNSRTSKIQKAQINISKPKLNRLWKEVVISKILNQADVLNSIKKDEYLYKLIKRVHSADKGNIEAVAAAYYFKELFGKSFCRSDDEDSRNMVLNYGYSIIRSSIIRHLVAYGLNPSFGMWHSSELNAYNLADDLLEPFRPIVDKYVVDNVRADSSLTTQRKHALMALLYHKVKNNNNQNISVNDAIKSIVSSYQSYCLGKRDDIELFFLVKR